MKIIVIANPGMLPYLALGLPEYSLDIKIVPFSEMNEEVIRRVEGVVGEFV